MDYAALAAQYGGKTEPAAMPASAPTSAPAVDYAALAAQYGGTTDAPADEGSRSRAAKQADGYLFKQIQQALPAAIRGAGSIGSTLLRSNTSPEALARSGGGQSGAEADAGRRKAMDGVLMDLMGYDPESPGARVFKTGTEALGTAGLGGALAAPIRAALPRLAEALASGGFSAGQATPGALGWLANMATRTVGGAGQGVAAAGAVNPEDAMPGGMIGGALPLLMKSAGVTGQVVGNFAKPFHSSGQDALASKLMREFATDPQKAAAALRSSRPVVPGSEPISAAASGDTGLANLTRTMQNASGETAGNLQTRQWAQNAARTNAIEDISGNVGKLSAAKEARDAATEKMREEVLARAGRVDSQPVLDAIDFMLANPDSAGKLSQSALRGVKTQIASATSDGQINARALYAIRKDINDTLSGKLQGEAGNLRYASGELVGAKNVIDDAIEEASKRGVPPSKAAANGKPGPSWVAPPYGGPQALGGPGVPLLGGPPSRAVAAPGVAQPPSGAPPLSLEGQAPTGWRDYLAKYTELSKPINQMETLQEVMKRAQTGSTDNLGNLIMSGPKLNTILKNETEDLKKVLTPKQLQSLRDLAGDLNASTHGMTAGKALGSNSVQNLSQDAFLKSVLGAKFGASTPARMVLGNALKLPYMRANQSIMSRIDEGLMNPAEGARMLDESRPASAMSKLIGASQSPLSFLQRAAPVVLESDR